MSSSTFTPSNTRYARPLELLEVKTEEEVETLRQMVVHDDVWQAFRYFHPPTKGRFFLRFFNKQWVGYLIRDRTAPGAEPAAPVGLIIVMLQGSRTSDAIEVDMAVPDPALRGTGITQTANALLLDLWLMPDRIGQVFMRTTRSNTLAVKAAASFGYHFIDPPAQARAQFGEPDDAVMLYMSKAMWQALREQHNAEPWVAPDGGQVYPPLQG